MPAPPLRTDAPPTVAYTDGSSSREPGPRRLGLGGRRRTVRLGGESHTTNQRMEVMAVIRALQALSGPVHVVSDSTYVVNCFRQRWHEGWKRRRLEEFTG